MSSTGKTLMFEEYVPSYWDGVTPTMVLGGRTGVTLRSDAYRSLTPAMAREIAAQLIRAADFAMEAGCPERFIER